MTPSSYTHGRFCWVDLVAHDMSSSIKFYTDLFGWTVEDQDPDSEHDYTRFLYEGETVAGIGQMSDEMIDDGVPPTWNSYISVDDIEAAVDEAEALGATIVTPPMQVVDAGWTAFVEDPTGATVAFWQANEHNGATRVNEPATFCWNELNTRDAEVARDFFRDLLGWTYEENTDSEAPYFIIQNEERSNGGMLQMTEDWEGVPPHWMVYFAVSDLDRGAERVQELGGALRHGPFDTPMGRMAMVTDPEGAAFHLIALEGEGD